MPLAQDEYVIHISVSNETDEFQNIFIFQQEDALGLMFSKVFPVAWQVFPLPGQQAGVERKGIANYPSSQQIGITREQSPYFAAWCKAGRLPHPGSAQARRNLDLLLKLVADAQNKLIIKVQALSGDAFHYTLDAAGGQYLTRLSDKNEDGSITCRNDSKELAAVDVYRDGARCAVWPDLASGDTARFLLKNTLCLAYDDDMRPGQRIPQKITGDGVASVNLAGCSSLEARLTYDPKAPGKKKQWIITKH